MAQSFNAVLFDKDGTLIDYHLSWEPINRRAAALAAAGDAALAARLIDLGGVDPATGRARAGSLLAAGTASEIAAAWIAAGAPYELGALTAALDGLFAAGADDAVPVVDLAALFDELRAMGLAIGIASSDSEAAAFARAVDTAPDRMVVVGDNAHDMHMGRAAGAGLIVAVLASGTGVAEELAGLADALLPDIGRLPALIADLREDRPRRAD